LTVARTFGRRAWLSPWVMRSAVEGRVLTANRTFYAASAALALVCATGGARAQAIGDSIVAPPASENFARDRNISVRQRPRAEYEALGAHVGGFLLFPRLLLTGEHDDNVFALPSNKEGDWVFRVQPELALNSNWSRHQLMVYGRSTFTRYNDNSSENSDEWTVGGAGRLDIRRDESLSGGVDMSRLTEPRTSNSTQGASVVPIQYYLNTANVGYIKEFNRLRATARFNYYGYDYRDGRTITGASLDQDDRDRDEYVLTLRGDYAISPATALFVEVAGNRHEYDLGDAEIGLTRDSKGLAVSGGVNFELSNLVRGEIGAGYIHQTYSDPRFDNIDGLGVRAQLEWFPTQLTTVSFTGSRQIQDSGIPGTAGYLASNYAAQIDHELLRNLILTGQVSYGDDDYKGFDRRDKHWRAGISGTYLMNRNIGLTVGYSYYDQNSSGLFRGLDYSINKVGATVTLQY
jgi:hypothetical protein